MNKSLSFSLSISFLIAGLLLFGMMNIAHAKNQKFAPDSEYATENGTYDVEGHSDLKVKVIVHQAGSTKGSPAVNPVLTCNLQDPDSSAITPSAGWHLPSAVVYHLNTSSSPVGSNLVTVAENAFSQWNSAVSGKVTFTRGSNTFTSRARFDG